MSRHLDNICEVENCENPCWKQVCTACARKMRGGTLPPQFGVVPNPTCTTPGCDRPAYSKWKSRCRGHEEFERTTGKQAESKRRKAPNGGDKPKCPMPGCTREARSKGLCGSHYVQSRTPKKTKPCLTEGCRINTSLGHCKVHSKQFEKYGFSWVGDRPGEQIAQWRESQKPFCEIQKCEKRATSRESRLCSTHRGDWRRKNCEESYYIRLMDQTTCDSCGAEPERLVTDHDHNCKHPRDSMCQECIRGRLCNGCNTALGLLREDLNVIERLGDYLKKHTS